MLSGPPLESRSAAHVGRSQVHLLERDVSRPGVVAGLSPLPAILDRDQTKARVLTPARLVEACRDRYLAHGSAWRVQGQADTNLGLLALDNPNDVADVRHTDAPQVQREDDLIAVEQATRGQICPNPWGCANSNGFRQRRLPPAFRIAPSSEAAPDHGQGLRVWNTSAPGTRRRRRPLGRRSDYRRSHAFRVCGRPFMRVESGGPGGRHGRNPCRRCPRPPSSSSRPA